MPSTLSVSCVLLKVILSMRKSSRAKFFSPKASFDHATSKTSHARAHSSAICAT